jgi:hypothetical protein
MATLRSMVETFYRSATLQSTLFYRMQVTGIYRFHHIPSFPPVFGLDQGSHKTHSGLQQSHHGHHAQYRYKCCRSGTHHTHPSCPSMSSDWIKGRPKSPSFPTMSSDWINGHIKLIQGCSSPLWTSMLNTVTSVAIRAHITHTPAFPTLFSNRVHGRKPPMSSSLHTFNMIPDISDEILFRSDGLIPTQWSLHQQSFHTHLPSRTV